MKIPALIEQTPPRRSRAHPEDDAGGSAFDEREGEKRFQRKGAKEAKVKKIIFFFPDGKKSSSSPLRLCVESQSPGRVK